MVSHLRAIPMDAQMVGHLSLAGVLLKSQATRVRHINTPRRPKNWVQPSSTLFDIRTGMKAQTPLAPLRSGSEVAPPRWPAGFTMTPTQPGSKCLATGFHRPRTEALRSQNSSRTVFAYAIASALFRSLVPIARAYSMTKRGVHRFTSRDGQRSQEGIVAMVKCRAHFLMNETRM